MNKVEKILEREDGSQVKIVATATCAAPTFQREIDFFVLRRDGADDNWKSVSDQPHPDWRKMSVDEYIKHGRSELLRTVKFGEISRVIQELKAQLQPVG